ncbi:MAG TPA: homoserine kinase [Gemmatimonadales bacterium]|nr:homoserine kinase [Gemmatimonadales bacterium]
MSVRVPGSTSNLGAGFDCVGVAVPRWLRLSAHLGGTGAVRLERGGTLRALAPGADTDLVYRGFLAACRRAGRAVPERLVLAADSEIPVARGLGSSAAAIVAGAAAAAALLELGIDAPALLAVGSELEGHPDNVAAAVLGGACLVLSPEAGGVVATPLAVDGGLAFVLAVPDFTVETKRARAVLPETLPYAQAVRGVAKSAALVQGLACGDPRLLAAALDDVLHVPYRRSLVRGYDAVVGAAREAGAYGATLSGSGPTLLAITPVARAGVVGEAMVRAWARASVAAEAFAADRPTPGYQVE